MKPSNGLEPLTPVFASQRHQYGGRAYSNDRRIDRFISSLRHSPVGFDVLMRRYGDRLRLLGRCMTRLTTLVTL